MDTNNPKKSTGFCNITTAVQAYLAKENHTSLHIKAVFFDMDGILFDSMPYHAKAWSQAFASLGIHFTEYQAYLNEGRTGASTINEAFLEQKGRNAANEEIQQLYQLKSDIFDSFGKAMPIKNVLPLLLQLQKDNIDIFVVTGSGQYSLFENLNASFPSIFSKNKMVTAYDVKYGKPNPEPYLIALQKSGLNKNQVCVIENAPLGVASGKAAGIFTIAINTGILKDEELIQAGADVLLQDMSELLSSYATIFKTEQKIIC